MGGDDYTIEKYGYPVDNLKLPVSRELINDLNSMEEEYLTSFDWDYPPGPSPWTEKQKKDFMRRATIAYERLREELDADFVVYNELEGCV